MNQTLLARAPAKLIISGEHSVVYGKPAIAVAVNKYTETQATYNPSSNFIFNLLNLESVTSSTIHTLKSIRQRLSDDYYDFLNGKCSIKDVVKKPFELLQFSVSNLFEKFNIHLPHGLDIKVDSSIPIGCGMGSSSAAVISTLYAVVNLLGISISPSKFFLISKEAENLQHGRSSGLDLYLSTHGGCRVFQDGVARGSQIPNLPMYIINTGSPNSTTGECVTNVKDIFHKSTISDDFAAVTNAIEDSFLDNDYLNLKLGVKENHKLLNNIGVVPAKVNSFIRKLEQNGAAGKICGAGSIKGDNAGILLAIGEEEILKKLANEYGYELEQLVVDTRGVHVV